MADDKLTHKSQEALSVAIRRAAADGSPQVEALHLLVALLEQADGTTAPLLRAVGADPALIAKQAEERLARQPRARAVFIDTRVLGLGPARRVVDGPGDRDLGGRRSRIRDAIAQDRHRQA